MPDTDLIERHLQQLDKAIQALELAGGEPGDAAVTAEIGALSKLVSRAGSAALPVEEWVRNFRSIRALFSRLLARFEAQKDQLDAPIKMRLSELYKECEQLVTAFGARLRDSLGQDIENQPASEQLLAAMQLLNLPLTDRQLLLLVDTAPELLDKQPGLILSLLPIAPLDAGTIDALSKRAADTAQAGRLCEVVAARVMYSAFLYTPVYRQYRLAGIDTERKALEKKIRTRNKRLRENFTRQLAALDREAAEIRQYQESAAVVLEQIRQRLTQDRRRILDDAVETLKASLETHQAGFDFQHRAGDVYLHITTYGFANLYAQLGGLPDFFTHSGIVLRDRQAGIPYYFVAEYTRNGFNVAPLSHLQQNKLVIVRPRFPLPADLHNGAKILHNLENLGPHSFDIRMIDQLRDAHGTVRLYCTEYVHYVFRNQFNLERHCPSPFDDIEGGLYLNEVGLHNAACIGQVTDQYYYVPDALFHSPAVTYVGHVFPWAALPVELDQSAYRARVGRHFNRFMTETSHSHPFRPLSTGDRLMAYVFRLPSRSGAARKVLERLSPEHFGGKVFVPVESNEQGTYFIRFARVAFSFEGAWEKARALEDGSKNPRWREDFEQKYLDKILPDTLALFDRPPAAPAASAARREYVALMGDERY